MTKIIDLSCADFVKALSSSAPVPGGGGGVGMSGAMGIALTNMVANLTIGKPKYAQVEAEIKELLAKGVALENQLLGKVDEDAAVFEPLSKAYGLPKATPEEKAHKALVLAAESKNACEVPLGAARLCLQGLKLQKRMAEIGSKLVISDVGCGAALMLGALTSARLNVLINLGAITDELYVEATRQEINELLTTGTALTGEIQQAVEARL